MAYTSARCVSLTLRHAPSFASHVRTVESQEPVKHSRGISGCHACARTLDSCPANVTTGATGRPSGPMVHTRAVLSSDTDISLPGTSGEKATPYTLCTPCAPSSFAARRLPPSPTSS